MKKLLPFYLILFVLASCKNNNLKEKANNDSLATIYNHDTTSIKRFGMVTGIREDKINYYKKLHTNAWPAVISKIKECNIQNYSIFLQHIDGKYFLFSYFEYNGKNFGADMKKMAADSTTQRWWKETNPTQLPLPEAAAKNEIWTAMEEVFHTN